jgi:hypothetical protein
MINQKNYQKDHVEVSGDREMYGAARASQVMNNSGF